MHPALYDLPVDVLFGYTAIKNASCTMTAPRKASSMYGDQSKLPRRVQVLFIHSKIDNGITLVLS